jgi:hypothetical protein
VATSHGSGAVTLGVGAVAAPPLPATTGVFNGLALALALALA